MSLTKNEQWQRREQVRHKKEPNWLDAPVQSNDPESPRANGRGKASYGRAELEDMVRADGLQNVR